MIEIKIVIKPENPNDFSESEIISDLKSQFHDITGYEIYHIDVNEV